MTASRLALVCDDTRLASTIQNHLQRAFGRSAVGYGLDTVRAQPFLTVPCGALGISRVTLYKKMQKYGLMQRPSHNGE
jgi:hypothetical protein